MEQMHEYVGIREVTMPDGCSPTSSRSCSLTGNVRPQYNFWGLHGLRALETLLEKLRRHIMLLIGGKGTQAETNITRL